MASLHEMSYSDWMAEQVQHLRRGEFDQLDIDNLIEELSDLGEESYARIESYLPVLIAHLLKLHCSRGSAYPVPGWRSEVRTYRGIVNGEIERTTKRHSSRSAQRLRERMPALVHAVYAKARRAAIAGLDDYDDPYVDVPIECPWSAEQVLDDDFWPTRD